MDIKIFQDKHPDYEALRHLRGSTIVIDSVIGGGKTTLGNKLATYLHDVGIPVRFFEEEVDGPFLELFLGDTSKYAYAFQMHMLANRQKVYMQAINHARQHNGVSIVDRSLVGDASFCALHHSYGNITDQEWEVYKSIVNKTQLPSPSAVIYLDVTPDVAMGRIKKRDRGSETTSYTKEYLSDLDIYHRRMYDESGTKVVYLDWNEPRTLSIDDLYQVCKSIDTM